MRSKYEIVKIAVSKNGMCLEYATEYMRNNYDILKIVVSSNGFALKYA